MSALGHRVTLAELGGREGPLNIPAVPCNLKHHIVDAKKTLEGNVAVDAQMAGWVDGGCACLGIAVGD